MRSQQQQSKLKWFLMMGRLVNSIRHGGYFSSALSHYAILHKTCFAWLLKRRIFASIDISSTFEHFRLISNMICFKSLLVLGIFCCNTPLVSKYRFMIILIFSVTELSLQLSLQIFFLLNDGLFQHSQHFIIWVILLCIHCACFLCVNEK